MRHLLILSTLVGCVGDIPPPPNLTVTSPTRGTSNNIGAITVTGNAVPGPTGEKVARVLVNNVAATLSPDGSFTASITVPNGENVIKTQAITEYGGVAVDTRSIRVGELRPVGSMIPRAVSATLNADAFAKLSKAATAAIKTVDIMAMIGENPKEAFSETGIDGTATLKKLAFSDFNINITPTDGGLMFSAEVDGINVGSHVDYKIIGIGSNADVTATTDKVTISGVLKLTAAGDQGFTAEVVQPNITIAKVKLTSGGLTGDILGLVSDHLQGPIQSAIKSGAEAQMTPMINAAFGAVMGPQQFSVLGQTLDLSATPSAIAFTSEGASVTMGLSANLEGSGGSPGYVFTENGTPTLDPNAKGVQVALADDLVNQLLAETHQLGLLDLSLKQDFGFVDQADFKLSLPPMISADAADGSLKLTIGDMIATFKDKGSDVVSAAVNAQISLTVLPGAEKNQIALQFGEVDLSVNVLTDPNSDGSELMGIANTGISVQLKNVGEVMINVPVPTVAGLSLDNLSLHGDQGFVVMGGDITN